MEGNWLLEDATGQRYEIEQEQELVLGRGRFGIDIKTKEVSRNQAVIKRNEMGCIEMEVKGNPCAVIRKDGIEQQMIIKKGNTVLLEDGDTINLSITNHPFKIMQIFPNSINSNQSQNTGNSKKRKRQEETLDPSSNTGLMYSDTDIVREQKKIVKKPKLTLSSTKTNSKESKLFNNSGDDDCDNDYTLGFCSFSTGVFAFDLQKAAEIACASISSFLSTHSNPNIKIILIDIKAETRQAFQTEYSKSSYTDSRFQIVSGDLTKFSLIQPLRFIANSANEHISPLGSGINRAVFDAAGSSFAFDTFKLFGKHFKYPNCAEIGVPYPVQVQKTSAFYKIQRVEWIIHISPPCMNQNRSNSVEDYEQGSELLKKTYDNLFDCFAQLSGIIPKTTDFNQVYPVKPKNNTTNKNRNTKSVTEIVLNDDDEQNKEEDKSKKNMIKNNTINNNSKISPNQKQQNNNNLNKNILNNDRNHVNDKNDEKDKHVNKENKEKKNAFELLMNSKPQLECEHTIITKPKKQTKKTTKSGLQLAKIKNGGEGAEGKAKDSWADQLSPYIAHPEKYPEQVYSYDQDVVIIKDKYPKSTHHYLVMPRQVVNGYFAIKKEEIQMLLRMKSSADKLIKDLNAKEEGQGGIEFKVGFHAIPSMRQLHMHVISKDLQAEGMKKKEHWNSFTTKFFIDFKDFLAKLKSEGKVEFDKKEYEGVKKETPLICHRCQAVHKTMPSLKKHIQNCKGSKTVNLV